MKQTLIGIMTTVFFLFLFSCKKQEKVISDPPYVVDLKIEGSVANDTLEFWKDGRIIAKSTTNKGAFSVSTLISITKENAEIQIRRKGNAQIITSHLIYPNAYSQTINCYDEGDKIYERATTLKINGYVQTGVLEFLLDGRPVAEATGKDFPDKLSIGIEEGKTRNIQVRRKGEEKILLTKEISTGQVNQNLSIFYDGTKIIDKVELNKPVNPDNMLIIFAFTSTLAVYTGPADIVICSGTGSLESYTPTAIRVELPEDGSFSKSVELPPLSNFNFYAFRLVKRGTAVDLPYNLDNELKPIKPISGIRSFSFVAGSSGMFVVSDQKSVTTAGPVSRWGTTFNVVAPDIAPYFQ